MLWGSAPIIALNAKRKWDVQERLDETFTTRYVAIPPLSLSYD